LNNTDLKMLSEQTYYHGTTRKLWDGTEDVEHGGLFVTTNLKDALNYADEAAIREAYDNEENGVDDVRPDAVIVSISGAELVKMLEANATRPAIEIEPDWGLVDGQESLAKYEGRQFEMPGWQQSLAACGGLLLSGFVEADKSGFLVSSYTQMEREVAEEKPPSFGL
jgi:hypothetical protein